jgi:hypothetical protein
MVIAPAKPAYIATPPMVGIEGVRGLCKSLPVIPALLSARMSQGIVRYVTRNATAVKPNGPRNSALELKVNEIRGYSIP